jgi:hypothetical protein
MDCVNTDDWYPPKTLVSPGFVLSNCPLHDEHPRFFLGCLGVETYLMMD